MKKQFSSLPLAPIALLVLSCCPAAAQRCDEYLSKSTCQVLIDMKSVRGPVTPQYKVAAPTHSDVTVNSGAAVTAVLRRASPFLACSIAATPGTPARDLSASIAGALTTFGGLVIPGELAGLEAQGETLSKAEVPLSILSVTPKEGVPPVSPEETLALVEKERKQLVGLETRTVPDLKNLYKELKDALQSYWRYSFAPDTDVEEAGQTHGQQDASAEHRARAAVDALAKKLNELLAASVPDLASIQALSKQMQDDFGTLYKGKTALTQAQADAARTVSANVGSAAAYADLLQSSASDFKKKVKQYADFVAGLNDPSRSLTLVPLPMDPYRQKTVTETITCKDAVSGTQPFAPIIFTAYYENTPVFDISTGAIASFLPGRQVGAVSGPLANTPASAGVSAPTSGNCGPFNPSETCLGITSTTRPQFMPAVFLELHPIQGKCPWAKNGEQRHPFGYVCSLGLAGGFAVNPNNGTGIGEFFEGVSFGISRLAFLAGIHNGHYETFTDGYYVGEAVPSGTTARTVRNWTNHFAVGITYRIVQR